MFSYFFWGLIKNKEQKLITTFFSISMLSLFVISVFWSFDKSFSFTILFACIIAVFILSSFASIFSFVSSRIYAYDDYLDDKKYKGSLVFCC